MSKSSANHLRSKANPGFLQFLVLLSLRGVESSRGGGGGGWWGEESVYIFFHVCMITNFCDWLLLVVHVPKYIIAVKTEVLNSYTVPP